MIGDRLDGPGGISSVVRTYRDAGLFMRHDIIYFSSYDGAGYGTQLRTMMTTLTSLTILLLVGQVGLIHLHSASRGSFWRCGIFSLLAKLFHIPYLLHIHSGEFCDFFELECGTGKKRLVRAILRNAQYVLCLTLGWERAIRRIEPSTRRVVMPNPVAIPDGEVEGQELDSPTILFLGRVSKKKGVFDLLLAMRRVAGVCPGLRLVIAGDGALDEARRFAAELGIEAVVEFLGWIAGPEKEKRLREALLVVLPSRFEGFPVSILEAMAYAKAVVATSVGGVPDVMSDGIHGVLLPPSNPEALADAITFLVKDAARCKALGQAGRHHVRQNFDAPVVMQQLERIYASFVQPATKASVPD